MVGLVGVRGVLGGLVVSLPDVYDVGSVDAVRFDIGVLGGELRSVDVVGDSGVAVLEE